MLKSRAKFGVENQQQKSPPISQLISLSIAMLALAGCDLNPEARESYFSSATSTVVWQQGQNAEFYACKQKSKCPTSNLKGDKSEKLS